ncbi:hypothetical protein PPSIR1_27158 [Plesiocystis pacifica SIR-1]|uniref:Secondary thiamine-phosphate synthase enzyme n=1 Tax=Plesiocystis pacifica SIR-1 TaxID=391625 RepID=A6GKC7_9BACT|nr:secondary thiamine-phosphate synthase enzyme YjbQ [Plesiocystis pacifica]EDM73686.1 hypothetical protein PPSIR1_27158 [Plesiocystis pacifica SIR-1]
MQTWSKTLTVATPGRGTTDISARVQAVVERSGVQQGLCNVFIHHTSASLIVCENADPQVREDLERFMARLIPDGDPILGHVDEGPDDMPSHVRSVLTATTLTFPVSRGRVPLGTWQGIYLWEHRRAGHGRKVTVTVQGETRMAR